MVMDSDSHLFEPHNESLAFGSDKINYKLDCTTTEDRYENLPMQYKLLKLKIFIIEFLIFFLFFAQNIDCG